MTETEDYDKSATPTAHKTSHEDGGTDEVSVAGLSGQLANNQPSSWSLVSGKPTTFTPEVHKTSHQDGGSDEISVAGLSGQLADGQTPLAHKTSHQDGGTDEISVAGLSGQLADGQTPLAHKTSHQDGGSDEISVAGLSGQLEDLQKPIDHSHQSSGSGVGGKIDHGLALDGLGDDDHPQYALLPGDRGDPSVWDFTVSNFTTDGAVHDLDCSSIVPPGARFIIFSIQVQDDATASQIVFRKKGNTNWRNFSGSMPVQVINIPLQVPGIVACDTNRVIEYLATNTTFTAINMIIIGWWF